MMKNFFGEFNRYRVVFILILVLSIAFLFSFPNFWSVVIGPLHFGAHSDLYPFLDMHGRLSAFEAHREGIDILYNPNPYDPMQRVNIKPTWPLHLSFLGLGREHLLIAGFTTVGLFLGILISILRPGKWNETLLLLVLCLSPPIFMGIERANDDLVYLILLSTIPPLLALKSSVRYWLVWLVVFFLAPAKYYPGAVFAILFLETKSWRLLGLLLGAGLVFVMAYFVTHVEEILYLRKAVPQPTVLMVHGANLTFESIGLPTGLGKVYSLGLMTLGVWILSRRKWFEFNLSKASQRWYLLGYSVVLFCFMLNSNYDYRFVYVLLMLPLLLELARLKETLQPWAKAAGVMMVLLIPVFWLDMLHLLSAFAIHGKWVGDNTHLMTFIKNFIFCIFMIGSTMIAATLVRPNVRGLCEAFIKEVRNKKPV